MARDHDARWTFDYDKWAEQVFIVRCDLSMTQKQLGDISGVSNGTISKIEQYGEVSLLSLIIISNHLGIDLAKFVRR